MTALKVSASVLPPRDFIMGLLVFGVSKSPAPGVQWLDENFGFHLRKIKLSF